MACDAFDLDFSLPDSEISVFSFIKRLFGEGYVYCDIRCSDGSTGRAKAPYIGDPATLNHTEFIQQVKDEIWFEQGKVVTEVTNIRVS